MMSHGLFQANPPNATEALTEANWSHDALLPAEVRRDGGMMTRTFEMPCDARCPLRGVKCKVMKCNVM